MSETISLPRETLLDAAAELYAVADFLTQLWGHQDGGTGNIADRISGPASELLAEAFGDGWADDDGGVMVETDEKAKKIIDAWLRDLGTLDKRGLLSPAKKPEKPKLTPIRGGRDA